MHINTFLAAYNDLFDTPGIGMHWFQTDYVFGLEQYIPVITILKLP